MISINKKITISIIICIFVLATCFAIFAFPEKVYADEITISNIKYTYTAGGTTASVTGYIDSPTNVTIESTIEVGGITYTVTSIGDNAFDRCTSLTEVVIPNSITSIGDAAFVYCTSLTKITIPNSVTSIGESAFIYCTSLKEISIPNSITSISNSAFAECDSLTEVVIPNSVTSIGNSAFAECDKLESVTIPNSVTSIGTGTFSDCISLKSVSIPNSITSISNSAFAYCDKLESVTIPNSVTNIGLSTFQYCISLESVIIPESVTSIGKRAFRSCHSLRVAYILGNPTLGEDCFFDSYGTGGLISKPSSLSNYIFYKESSCINEWDFDTDTRGDNSPTTLLYRIALSKPRPLTPEEWVLMDLNINELASHYGPTPQGFINMLYDSILTRVPDSSGQNYWREQLTSGNFTGGQIAEHFIFSDELGKKTEAMNDKEFITFLYNSLLSRQPDTEGYNNWISYMNTGVSKLDILRAFINNKEWFDICAMFNITP